MKQTKRLLAFLLSAALCVSLAACSSDTSDTGTTETSTADTTAEVSTFTESDAGDSGADYYLDASVYQSGNTIEAVASGSFIEDFLTMAGEQTDCEFYMSFETEDGGGFIFNAIPDGEYLWGYCYDFNVDDGSEPNMMYGGDSIAFSWQGYTGDFSEITSLYVYAFVGDEYLDGGAFEVASVMLGSSIFDGGSSSSSSGDIAYLSMDSSTVVFTLQGTPVSLMNSYADEIEQVELGATLRGDWGDELGRVEVSCVNGEWSASYLNIEAGSYTMASCDVNTDAITVSFDASGAGLDSVEIESLSVYVNTVEIIDGVYGGETIYYQDDVTLSLGADSASDADSASGAISLETFEGTYYVYNNVNYTLPLTITTNTSGEGTVLGADIVFFHNAYTYHTWFEASDFVSTSYGDDCIVFTKDEDNIIASFVLNGSTPYVSIYINYSDGDTGAKAVYDYKIEDQVTTVDDAFISEYMGEYFDIESGQDLCNLGLYNGGYLGYKDVDGVTYTVDTILGAELVNGNQVNVTLTASDGTTFDASISFGHNGNALRASVNGGWIMEAND